MRDDEYAIRRKITAFQDHPTYERLGVKLAYFECREGRYYDAQPLTISEVPDARNAAITPFATVSRDMAQELFDDLWRMGFRPDDGTGNSGHLEAIKYHLEDMRKLVFAAPLKCDKLSEG